MLKSYVCFDLETTGLSPLQCEIIEIAADLVCQGEIQKRFHTYVKPNTLIPTRITELTGITDEMVKDYVAGMTDRYSIMMYEKLFEK